MLKKLSRKVFIVDDNEMLTMALQDYLTRKTMHTVEVFGTGEECIRHIDEQPDIIILDYNLNSVEENAANGEQILEVIKKLDPSIHVIMLSSQDAYGTALKTVMKGADTYILKDADAFGKIEALIEGLQ